MKKISVFLFLLLILLCQFSSAYCRGKLGDNDAYDVYIGKTETEVKQIAPHFEKLTEDQYLVDYHINEGEILGILVMFGESRTVDSTGVLVSKDAMKEMNTDTDPKTASLIAMITLGFDSEEIIDIDTENDMLTYILESGVKIGTLELSDSLYVSIAVP